VVYPETNYWLGGVPMPTGTSGTLPERVDVAVIGAGYTGLAASRALARHGARVAVLEAHTIGWGASSRNGGMVLTGLKVGIDTLAARYGMAAAKRMYAASLASIDETERLIAEERIDCDYARCGHLEVAAKPAHFDRYARLADLAHRELGQTLRVIPRADLPGELGSDRYHGGLVDERSAGLHPARYVAGLARSALAAGACIYEQARVTRVSRAAQSGAPGIGVDTDRGRVFARDLVVATSGYTSGATPAVHRRVVPIGSFIIATEPLPDSLASALIPRNRMVFDSKHFLHYYRLTPDRRLLFGGRAAFFPETPATVQRSAAILHRDLLAVFPGLRDTRVQYAWGGTLDFCFDTMPHAGRLDGLYHAVGYAGHGVAMATHLGRVIADVVAGRPADNPFADIPFPTAPLGLYRGRPWFLPAAGAWYRVRDWVE
jgi:glycine/D-amino acid oxidase-like deaminating enzyme